jgi:hypothetical protein
MCKLKTLFQANLNLSSFGLTKTKNLNEYKILKLDAPKKKNKT